MANSASLETSVSGGLFSFRFGDQPTFLGIREVTKHRTILSSSHHVRTSCREPLRLRLGQTNTVSLRLRRAVTL